MFIPFISTFSTKRRRSGLDRRAGGGGGGGGGGGRGGSTGGSGSGRSGGGGSSSGGRSGGSTGSRSPSISTGNGGSGSSKPISSISTGGGPVSQISSGAFAGRSIGGGSRSQVYGTRQYGSGYPGVTGAGVAGRGFPFYFWPVTWGAAAGAGTAAYYHNRDDEYGRPDNTSRPGGTMTYATFDVGNSTMYHLLADNATVSSLIISINSKCSGYTITANTTLSATTSDMLKPYDASAPNATKPENVIQYYRASSVALALDGYNNSAVFSNDTNAPDTPLPTGLNTSALDCLNQTIGASAPLVRNAAVGRNSTGVLYDPLVSLMLLMVVLAQFVVS
ncbi:hypothetical protein PQX77_004247 [Marasmius sp. AFHP31]|nr:hypothetical protein PQX77_004247 [Marasmius sp. AFHP31]